MTGRLRRSLLYTPADNRSMMERGAETAADAIIFDLEDAIPDDAVSAARDRIVGVVAENDFGEIEICVRINGLQTGTWLEDTLAAVEAGVDMVVLPMVEQPTHLETAVRVAADAPGPTPEFVPTVETPQGVANADAIAKAARTLPPVTGFSFGFGDYTNAVGATGRPERLRDELEQVTVRAAALGGLAPLATVYQDYADEEGLREAARQARAIGFVGQKAIHPSQIEILNEMFTPSSEEVQQAQRFVDAFESADRDSIVVDGTFLDTAIVEQYRTVIARDEEVDA